MRTGCAFPGRWRAWPDGYIRPLLHRGKEHGADVADGNGAVVELVRRVADGGVRHEERPGVWGRVPGGAQGRLVRESGRISETRAPWGALRGRIRPKTGGARIRSCYPRIRDGVPSNHKPRSIPAPLPRSGAIASWSFVAGAGPTRSFSASARPASTPLFGASRGISPIPSSAAMRSPVTTWTWNSTLDPPARRGTPTDGAERSVAAP